MGSGQSSSQQPSPSAAMQIIPASLLPLLLLNSVIAQVEDYEYEYEEDPNAIEGLPAPRLTSWTNLTMTASTATSRTPGTATTPTPSMTARFSTSATPCTTMTETWIAWTSTAPCVAREPFLTSPP